MVEDMSDVLAEVGLTEYTVKRPGAATYVNGRLVEAPTTELLIEAVAHPATPKELERLPEGQRNRETVVFHTTTLLRTAAGGTTDKADLVVYAGADYEVQSVDDWMVMAGFCRAIAQRVG